METKGLIRTVGDACRQQGRALLQQLLVFVHDRLSHGATANHVFNQILAKQQGIDSGVIPLDSPKSQQSVKDVSLSAK